jgi:formylmethanofuran dehydrogenase subunit E
MSEAETEPIDVCDGCHEPLAYPGNELVDKSFCDMCYDRRVSTL